MEIDQLPTLLTIGDIARKYGLTLRALRFYEDRGLLKPLRLGHSRFYDTEAQKRIVLILRGKHLGYSLRQVERLLSKQGASDDTTLVVDQKELDEQICRLESKRDELNRVIAELRTADRRSAGAPLYAGASAA